MNFYAIIWGLAGLFAVGKMTGYLDWSWWLVLSPLLASMMFGAVLFIIAAIVNFTSAGRKQM